MNVIQKNKKNKKIDVYNIKKKNIICRVAVTLYVEYKIIFKF